jgi:RHS repeat-associated protein
MLGYEWQVYAGNGTRVVKSVKTAGDPERHWVSIFSSLRLDHARFDAAADEFERTPQTESVLLGRLGRVVYLNGPLPSLAGHRQHVFLELADNIGSTSTVIDRETSELVERITYQPYGSVESDYRPDRWKNFREQQQFAGRFSDPETGLIRFGARYYEPALGRWASADPLVVHGRTADLNPYAYVNQSPLTNLDATGLQGSPCYGREWEGACGGDDGSSTGGDPNGGFQAGPGAPGSSGSSSSGASNGEKEYDRWLANQNQPAPFYPYANESSLSRWINTGQDPISGLIRSKAFDNYLLVNQIIYGAAASVAIVYLGGEALGAAEAWLTTEVLYAGGRIAGSAALRAAAAAGLGNRIARASQIKDELYEQVEWLAGRSAAGSMVGKQVSVAIGDVSKGNVTIRLISTNSPKALEYLNGPLFERKPWEFVVQNTEQHSEINGMLWAVRTDS